MTKWLNPDATQADLGEGMQAYYDEKRKVWVFPGEDPDEKAKPIGPPPTTPMATTAQSVSAPVPAPATTDPLAAMMAPPKRSPALGKSKSAGSPPSRLPPGVPGTIMPPGGSASQPVPQFAVFTPQS